MASVATYDRIRDLPLTVEGYELRRLEQPWSEERARVTTVVALHGGGHEGLGEDVGYDEVDHVRHLEAGAVLPLGGAWTLDSFSRHLDGLTLFPEPPEWEAYHDYRRWAFESAALDLALRQADTSLADAVERPPAPLTFVTSRSLGSPPDPSPVFDLVARVPGIRFKLDADPAWSDELIAALADTGRVDTIDLKGHYEGTIVDPGADPRLYRRIVRAFPDAWLEDPRLTPETRPIIEECWERVTWDAPFHRLADVAALEVPPRMMNVKPSRFGRLAELLAVYDALEGAGIGMYGGGQGELGPGRGQIQYLAALFHPGTPNDVAPRAYNLPELPDDLPAPPLAPDYAPTGFRRRDDL